MLRIITIVCTLCVSVFAFGAEADSTVVRKSLVSKGYEAFADLFFGVDTVYVEPMHYKYQLRLSNSYSYEAYRITDNDGNSIRFDPKPSMKVGPYISWNIFSVGWTVDLLPHDGTKKRKQFDISFHTQPFSFDLFYRKSGDDYSIKNIAIDGVDASKMEGSSFHGLESGVIGMNTYYIFNHRRFSYSSAFSRTRRQKISCGSPLAGIGFTQHSLHIDWQDLDRIAKDKIGEGVADKINNGHRFEKVTYTDLSLNGGYAYNWVVARNLLVAASLTVALSHKRSASESHNMLDVLGEAIDFSDFKFSDLTLDGTGRLGFVWNNDRWFAGANATMHAYNYSRQNFYTNNIFGSVDIYAGFNFGAYRKYRKDKKK